MQASSAAVRLAIQFPPTEEPFPILLGVVWAREPGKDLVLLFSILAIRWLDCFASKMRFSFKLMIL
jgi:hypothetical protein